MNLALCPPFPRIRGKCRLWICGSHLVDTPVRASSSNHSSLAQMHMILLMLQETLLIRVGGQLPADLWEAICGKLCWVASLLAESFQLIWMHPTCCMYQVVWSCEWVPSLSNTAKIFNLLQSFLDCHLWCFTVDIN